MSSSRKGLSSVYGFIVLFTLFMAGIGAALTIMSSQASVWNAQDRARQIQAGQQVEHLALSLNGTSLTVRNVGLIPSQLAYLYQKGASTSADRRIGRSLQEGSTLAIPVTAGMLSFAIMTSLGNVFWVNNSTLSQSQPTTVPVTFDAYGLDPTFGSANILTVDGLGLAYSSMPKTFEWTPGSVHNYAYVGGYSTGSGSRVGWSYARGISSTINGTLKVSSAGSVVSTYGQQYLLTISGGNGVQYLGSPSNDGWYDSGRTGQFVSNCVWGASGGSRLNLHSYSLDGSSAVGITRIGDGTFTSNGVTMSSPHTVVLNAITQYQLAVSGGSNVALGGSQTNDGWFDQGSAAAATTDSVWTIVPGQSRLDLVSWNLDGGTNQSVPRAGAGTYSTTSITMNTFHTLKFNPVTQYYVTAQGSAPSSGSISPGISIRYSYVTSGSGGQTTPGPWTSTTHYGPGGVWHSGVWIRLTLTPPAGQLVNAISESVSFTLGGLYPGAYMEEDASGCATQSAVSSAAGGTLSVSVTCSTPQNTAIYQYFQVDAYPPDDTDPSEGPASATFSNAIISYTYTQSSSGSTMSSISSFTASGGTVTYSYGVGYNFPGDSTGTSWSATWPSTESYVSNSCSGGSMSGNTVTGIGGPCTLTTTSSGSFGISMGSSPTGDSWYDDGATLTLSTNPTGPFSFLSWSSSTGGITIAATGSASTSATVSNYGTITANFGVGP